MMIGMTWTRPFRIDMFTKPDGTKSKNAPPCWPFGTVKPPTKKELQEQILREADEALL
jgi:hypothetical protein